ncbi:MAG: lasso peptide biosynthesis B2 protein [Gaiellales bacterium]
MPNAATRPLSLPAKVELALRIWTTFLVVQGGIRRQPLPDFVAQLGGSGRQLRESHSPAQLSRAVYKSLRIGSRRPKCLVNSLVLFHLLRTQGDPAELVIGLPEEPADHFAHAWVEVEGVDVGPPPGRNGHRELARFR